MDSKTRLLTAWRFEEPDRVPIEMFLTVTKGVMELPGAAELLAFQKNEADNFLGVPGFKWGFLGLDAKPKQEILEDSPGAFRRVLRTQQSAVGDFTAITRHDHEDLFGEGDPDDFYWEKQYVACVEDMRRLIDASRERRPFDVDAYNAECAGIGGRGVPCMGLFHPLGNLVRSGSLDEVYSWFAGEERLILAYLEVCTEQIVDSVLALRALPLKEPPVFRTWALEMLIPPWFGKEQFEKFVFPFDSRVNEAIHDVGGRHFAHVHGNTDAFLERFVEMGIDAVEPLEPPPYGDNDLARAKSAVGRDMMLCGNIPSQLFSLESFSRAELRDLVLRAIDIGAPGGGFALRTTGSAHVGNGKSLAQKARSIQNGLAMIEAWREACARC